MVTKQPSVISLTANEQTALPRHSSTQDNPRQSFSNDSGHTLQSLPETACCPPSDELVSIPCESPSSDAKIKSCVAEVSASAVPVKQPPPGPWFVRPASSGQDAESFSFKHPSVLRSVAVRAQPLPKPLVSDAALEKTNGLEGPTASSLRYAMVVLRIFVNTDIFRSLYFGRREIEAQTEVSLATPFSQVPQRQTSCEDESEQTEIIQIQQHLKADAVTAESMAPKANRPGFTKASSAGTTPTFVEARKIQEETGRGDHGISMHQATLLPLKARTRLPPPRRPLSRTLIQGTGQSSKLPSAPTMKDSSVATAKSIFPFKVSKRGQTPLPRNSASRASPTNLNSASQPSEEDLYYLLMHKLRKREETEANVISMHANAVSQIDELTRNMDEVHHRLEDSENIRQDLQQELDSKQQLLDSFKARFDKVTKFVNGLGHDFDTLRKEKDILRTETQDLVGENSNLTSDLKVIDHAINEMQIKRQTQNSEQKALVLDIKHSELRKVELQERLTEKNMLLAEARDRVARLEAFVANEARIHAGHMQKLEETMAVVVEDIRDVARELTKTRKTTEVINDKGTSAELLECLDLVKAQNASNADTVDLLARLKASFDAFTTA